MNRTLSRLFAAGAVVAAGVAASACDTAPWAATVGSQTITVAQLNATLSALTASDAGRCLLTLQNPQLLGYSGVGAGGTGTYATAFAGSVLSNLVVNALAAQRADDLGLRVTRVDRTVAAAQYAKVLDGEIRASLQSSGGGGSPCVTSAGAPLTGAALLAGLPADVRDAQVASQAVDAALLAHGADLSGQAVAGYYAAHQDAFTTVCMGVIATANQADADTVVNQLTKGAGFAEVARASSVDKASGAKGGDLGCNFTEARVKTALQLTSLTVGQPVTPIQTSVGIWAVYQATSSTVQPLDSVRPLIQSELLRGSANVQRVSAELVAHAKTTPIDVNVQYGTWHGLRVVPPPAPAPRYLAPFTASTSGGTGAATSPAAGTTGG